MSILIQQKKSIIIWAAAEAVSTIWTIRIITGSLEIFDCSVFFWVFLHLVQHEDSWKLCLNSRSNDSHVSQFKFELVSFPVENVVEI